ncbi:unnamed protein product [Laminaria digitata]
MPPGLCSMFPRNSRRCPSTRIIQHAHKHRQTRKRMVRYYGRWLLVRNGHGLVGFLNWDVLGSLPYLTEHNTPYLVYHTPTVYHPGVIIINIIVIYYTVDALYRRDNGTTAPFQVQ